MKQYITARLTIEEVSLLDQWAAQSGVKRARMAQTILSEALAEFRGRLEIKHE